MNSRRISVAIGLTLAIGLALSSAPVVAASESSIWSPSATPQGADNDSSAVELGVRFRSDVAGFITGVRFYKFAGNTGTHVGNVWTEAGTLLASATFSSETASGWQQVTFATPVAISANTTYIASYHTNTGHYAADSGYFAQSVDNAPLHALQDGAGGANGVYRYGASSGFPNQSWQATNYWVDVVFTASGGNPTAPTVTQVTPPAGAVGVSATTVVTATFSEMMNTATLNTSTFELRDVPGSLVTASVFGGGETPTATLTPSSPLISGQRYIATVKGGPGGVKDLAGEPMAADYSWSFTVGGTPPPTACPCTVWNGTTSVGAMDSDTNAVELGVRFQSETSGYILGVRFYKHAGNGGVHIGNLWSNTGTRLATANFTGETPAGWQQVSFSTPVAIAANTTYVASYHTDSGHYAASRDYFTSGFDRAPLHALRDGVDGPSGVYRYGVPSGFPEEAYASANYWVDVVFAPTVPSRPLLNVGSVSPAPGATGVSTTTSVRAGISGPVWYGSVETTTFVLRDPAGNVVPATVVGGGESQTFPLTPTSPLAANTTYTATVKGGPTGIKDLDGTPMAADYSWSFTSGGAVPSPQPPPVACPCTIWNGASTTAAGPDPDTSAVELGMRFRSDVNGFITGLRFYKFPGNTGTHIGNLWSNAGALLASATFANESSSGWQQVNFASPVAIAANTTYVASYHTNSGRYAVNSGYFAAPFDNPPLHALRDRDDGPSGVYRYVSTSAFPMDTYLSANYWVDVVFATSPGSGTGTGDVTPPAVTSTSPGAGASNVDVSTTTVTATFSEPMDPPTINSGTVELHDASGALVSATVVYNLTNAIAILRPSSPLASGTTYTATVVGGSAPFPAKDLAGNALAASYSWSFTTAGVAALGTPSCPCTLWSASAAPAASDPDASAVEVGVRFQSDTAGYITGLRFFKMPGNDGIHRGSLWTNNGGLLARATFVNESATGWQQINFPSPVAISANTTYVASYHTDAGHYAVDIDYFASPYDKSPLHALRDGVAGSNGVYVYSTTAAFPSQTYQSSNYWVDVVFNSVPPVDTTPPSVFSVTPAAGSTGVSVTSVITATFTELMSAAAMDTTTFELRDSLGNVVPASVWAGGETPTATLSPMSPLAYGTTYTATVKGGANGVKDMSGNPMGADFSWSLTTESAPADDFLEGDRGIVVDEVSSNVARAIVATSRWTSIMTPDGNAVAFSTETIRGMITRSSRSRTAPIRRLTSS